MASPQKRKHPKKRKAYKAKRNDRGRAIHKAATTPPPDHRPCTLCGRTESETGNRVTFEPDSWSELRGDMTPVWECERCRAEAELEI